jgi:Protein of unknown function (DUF1360)
MTQTASRPASLRDYDPEGEVNLAGYTGSLGAFVATAATAGLVVRAKTHEPPENFSMTDVLLGGLATHKVSRLLAKGAVTSPIRAWFTTFEGAAGSSEHRESPRDEHGLRHTVGELLTCPFCLAQWVGLAYVAGLVVAPGPTRVGATVFAVAALSDSLQHIYERLVPDS